MGPVVTSTGSDNRQLVVWRSYHGHLEQSRTVNLCSCLGSVDAAGTGERDEGHGGQGNQAEDQSIVNGLSERRPR